MSKKDFKFYTEEVVGKLTYRENRQWRSLQRRERDLKAAGKELADDAHSFNAKLLKKYPAQCDPRVTVALKVDEDGTVSQSFCDCGSCQARLNNITVNEAIDKMVAGGHLGEAQALIMKTEHTVAKEITARAQKRGLYLN